MPAENAHQPHDQAPQGQPVMVVITDLPTNIRRAAELINCESGIISAELDRLDKRMQAEPESEALPLAYRARAQQLAAYNDLLQLLSAPIVRLIAHEQLRQRQAAARAAAQAQASLN